MGEPSGESVTQVSIKRLGCGDERVLTLLATQDADFDLDGRSAPLAPLAPDHAQRFLADDAVLLWTAMDGDEVVGFLFCLIVPLRSGDGQELLLYEIGVRSAWRRRGVGRALLDEMERWMKTTGVSEVWVLSDNPAAVEFYRGCGFASDPDQPTYMTREITYG